MSSFRLKIELDSRKHNRYSIELSEETRLKDETCLFYAFVNNSSKYSGSRFVWSLWDLDQVITLNKW